MTITDNEMMFIYNSGIQTDRVALGYAQAVPGYVLKEHDTRKEQFTELQIKEIATKLKVQPIDLVDKRSDLYLGKYKDTELSENDVLTVLKHEPGIMRTPIVLYHDTGEFIGSKYEFVKRGMAPPDTHPDQANTEEKD